MPALRGRRTAPRAGEHRGGGRIRLLTPGPHLRVATPRAAVVAVVVLALLVVGLVLSGCGPTATPAPSFPTSPVDGVIVAVDASSLTDVRGFTLLTRDGARIGFTLGPLENPTEFPPGHLKEHEATSEPIRVFFRVENGVPVVYRLGDASEASPAAT